MKNPFAGPLTAIALMWLLPVGAIAQEAASPAPPSDESNRHQILSFLGGAATGLATHEAGHLLFGWMFEAKPALKGVDFAGIPFFAIAHRRGLSPRREFAVSAAGFWVQHATSELVLSRHPQLRRERAPFKKGVLAFNILTSVGYSAAAAARLGPYERDTRAISDALKIDERWIGVMVLAPAVLDALRYFHPDSRWATWSSRAVKVGVVLLVLK